MTSFRDRLNAHLPIVLQFLSTASLVVLAISALCGSQSLKKLADEHKNPTYNKMHKSHMMHKGHMMHKPQRMHTHQ